MLLSELLGELVLGQAVQSSKFRLLVELSQFRFLGRFTLLMAMPPANAHHCLIFKNKVIVLCHKANNIRFSITVLLVTKQYFRLFVCLFGC